MEKLSALMDGELAPGEMEQALAALGGPEAQARWRLWQLIGATLRASAGDAVPAPSAEALP